MPTIVTVAVTLALTITVTACRRVRMPYAPPLPRKMFFSREKELRVAKVLGELGFGPALLATLEDGRVEEFLEGKVIRSVSETTDDFVVLDDV